MHLILGKRPKPSHVHVGFGLGVVRDLLELLLGASRAQRRHSSVARETLGRRAGVGSGAARAPAFLRDGRAPVGSGAPPSPARPPIRRPPASAHPSVRRPPARALRLHPRV